MKSVPGAGVHLRQPVSILMPVCNEEDVIEEVIREWHDTVVSFLPEGTELVLDDCSDDRTPEILHRLATTYPYIRVFRSARDGFRNAAIRLYRSARCPLVFFTDSDGQYTPSDFWRLAAELTAFDMVHGYKERRADPLFRIGASAAFNRLTAILFGSKGKDINSAFRLMHRQLPEAFLERLNCLPMLPNAELYIRAEASGWRIKDVPVRHRPRKVGQSRGLPPATFAAECWRTLKGLLELRRDLRRARSAGRRGSAP